MLERCPERPSIRSIGLGTLCCAVIGILLLDGMTDYIHLVGDHLSKFKYNSTSVWIRWNGTPDVLPVTDRSCPLCNSGNSTSSDGDFNITLAIKRTEAALRPYMAKLESYRKLFLNQTLPMDVHPRIFTTLQPKTEKNYFNIIAKYPAIKTVKVELSMDTLKQLELRHYYKGYINTSMSHPVVSIHRDNNSLNIQSPMDLNITSFKKGIPPGYPLSPARVLVSYIHVIPGGIVLNEGQALHKNLKILPGGCDKELGKLNSHREYPSYDEVFSISQYWGEGFFHASVENIPRLAPYLTFLLKHKNILIQVKTRSSFTLNMLAKLGISQHRVITGAAYAKILYMPTGMRCGTISHFPGQLTSLYYRQNLPTVAPEERTSIIIIKRSAKRYFTRHHEIVNKIKKIASVYHGIDVKVFPDNPLPSFDVTLDMFNRAFMVVGPHGAGLSNLFFSHPGTIVVEGLCFENPKIHKPNLCYAHLAFVLGHVYHGIIPSEKSDYNCRKTSPEDVVLPVSSYLEYLRAQNVISEQNIL